MHVLIAASGSYGDIYPFVGLGRLLRLRGHEVDVCTNEHFQVQVKAEGLGFVSAGSAEYYDQTIRHPNIWHPKRGIELVLRSVAKFLPLGYDVLRRHYREGETLLVASTLALAARLLRETHGGRLVTVHLAPNVFRSGEDAIRLPNGSMAAAAPKWLKRLLWKFIDRAAIDRLVGPGLNRYRAELGLAPVKYIFRDWIHSPDRVIGMFPEWFASPRADWPAQTRLSGFPLYDAAEHEPLPDSLESFLAAGDAPVMFAPGTANTAARKFFETSLAACRRSGRRALFVSRYGRQVPGKLPDWARHFNYLPFSKILPRCSAFVSHGGVGSVSQGFRAGVPQLVRPMGFDQFDNGRRAENLGVACSLPTTAYQADAVVAAFEQLAEPECAQACIDVARQFADGNGLQLAADLVEQTGI